MMTMDKGEKRSFDQMEQSSPVSDYVYSENDDLKLTKMAAKRPRFLQSNGYYQLDANSKLAALKASHSVVSLVSFSAEVVLFQCSGVIIEVEENSNVVMTSANLIRRFTEGERGESCLAENLKIIVRSSDDNSYIGEIFCYDFHYNLLIVQFKSKFPLPPAKLRLIEDEDDLCLEKKSFQLRPHNLKVKDGGDHIVVVGRYFYKPFDLMAAAGRFRTVRCDPLEYNCRELWSAICAITICGDGGPLINLFGEVVGIGFYEIVSTVPFLPINIASKWWNHFKKYKQHRHPSYGFEASDLYEAELDILEWIWKKFPNISNGLLVEKVMPNSYAETAGLREDDVIITCDGKTVKRFLELWELMWDKVGDVVVLEVIRVDVCTVEKIIMAVGEAVPDELNTWPRFNHPRYP